jgi:hypothetical protein
MEIKYIADKDSTMLFRGTSCCDGGHQTIAGAILSSPQWKAWYEYQMKNPTFDIDESQTCDMMSDKHFQAFISFIINNYAKK